MKKGINAWCFPQEYSIEEIFQMALSYGFQGVELNLGEGAGVPLPVDISKENLADIVRRSKEMGLELPSVSTDLLWKYPLTAEDPDIRIQGIRIVEKMIDVASLFEASTVLVVPGLVTEEVAYDVACYRALEAVTALESKARDAGVTLGIENVWNKFLLSPLEMRDFIDQVGSPYVGAYFDIGNVLQFGYPDQWIRILGERIVSCHIKDFKTSVGNINGFVSLLSGDINWEPVLRALNDIGYQGYVLPEIPPHSHQPEQHLKQTSTAMDAIFHFVE